MVKDEWIKRNITLVKSYEKFNKKFSELVCSKCSKELQEKRKCIVYGSSGIKRCKYKDNIANRIFQDTITKLLCELMNIEKQEVDNSE